MRFKSHNYSSSRQSPCFHPYERKYRESLYSNMFIQDFTLGFSYDLAPNDLHVEMRKNFYRINPEDDALKRLILCKYNSFFDYEFDKLLSRIMYCLLVNGRTYLEIVSLKDKENTVHGIEFVCIPARPPRARSNTYDFTVKNYKEKVVHFSVDRNRLVIFDLKDLGYHRNFFRKMINHLSIFDATNAAELMLDSTMKDIFDFEKYQKSMDYKLLKDTHSIHWLGRDYSNQYLSESYHLYRQMQYKVLRYKFLQYILHQINVGLSHFKTEWGFSGEISTSVSLPPYEDLLIQYNKGEINSSTLCDIVLQNLTPEKNNS